MNHTIQLFLAYLEANPFKPNRLPLVVPFAYRQAHVPRHGVKLRQHKLRWAHSALRSTGEFLVGAFQPIAQAV